MPRRPQPWFNEQKQCYYVQVNKKQIRLSPDKEEAFQIYHRLMLSEGRLTEEEKRHTKAPELIDLFIESRGGRREETRVKYVKFLTPFAKLFRERRLETIKYQEVVKFCESHPGWGTGTRRGVYSIVVTLFRWARDAGHIEFNSLAGFPNPWPAQARERGLLPHEYQQLLAAIGDPEMRLLLRVLYATGCRPSEAYKLEARHLHELLPIATLAPEEHKTGGRTGLSRLIFYPHGLMEELRAEALRHPRGPILLNTKGRPWNTYNVTKRFSLYRQRLGLPRQVVPYATRHAFVTGLVNLDKPLPLIAKLVGHANISTIQSVYFHADVQRMIEIVNSQGEGRPVEIRAADPSLSPGA